MQSTDARTARIELYFKGANLIRVATPNNDGADSKAKPLNVEETTGWYEKMTVFFPGTPAEASARAELSLARDRADSDREHFCAEVREKIARRIEREPRFRAEIVLAYVENQAAVGRTISTSEAFAELWPSK